MALAMAVAMAKLVLEIVLVAILVAIVVHVAVALEYCFSIVFCWLNGREFIDLVCSRMITNRLNLLQFAWKMIRNLPFVSC